MNQLTSQSGGGVVEFKGTTNEPATVTIAGKPATGAGGSTFSGSAVLPAGTSTVAVSATDASGNTATQSYEVDVPASTASSTYDANGNLIAQGTKTYEWDAADRLVRMLDDGPEIARFAYDGNGRRVQKISGGTTRSYLYDGMHILEERSSSRTTRTVQGPGIDRPLASVDGAGTVSYYLADHLGSIVQQTNASATVTLTRQYDPYGVPLQGAATSGYAFTGQEWDAQVGLYCYRARYYDPALGRFLSQDPLGATGGSDLYAYVGNRPLSLRDPAGLFSVDDALYYSAQFSAGFGDSMGFGLTGYIRQQWETDDVIDSCGWTYASGKYVEIGAEVRLTAGSFALRRAAANITQQVARKGLSRAIPRGVKGVAELHHINPLLSGLFPTAWLPAAIRHNPLNLELMLIADHDAAHAALARAEAYLVTVFNPLTTSARIAKAASHHDCGCQ
jgi:RHS repeat-associated protein